jgi:hypothetical protein
MKSKLVQIFFFSGDAVETTEVCWSDLPTLSGARTFWRESMPDDERGKLLKSRIGKKMAELGHA